jgi:hypothetical protein
MGADAKEAAKPAEVPVDPTWREPYYNADNILVLPFHSNPKYHWWKGACKLRDVEKAAREAGAPLAAAEGGAKSG